MSQEFKDSDSNNSTSPYLLMSSATSKQNNHSNKTKTISEDTKEEIDSSKSNNSNKPLLHKTKQLISYDSNNNKSNIVNSDNEIMFEQQESLKNLSTELESYSGKLNPFLRRKFSLYMKFKIFFFTISGILLLRFLLFILLAIIAYIIAFIASSCCCLNSDKLKNEALPCFPKFLRKIIYFFIRVALFIFGFYYISVDDKLSKKKDKRPQLLVGNHHTAFDGFIILYLTGATVAAMKEIKNLPLIGSIGNLFQILWVDRHSRQGRKQAILDIKNRASNKDMPPLIIFPQGLTCNTKTITSFKPGAFLSGSAVQPISLSYRSIFDSWDISFCMSSIALEFFYAGCQFINFSQVKFLEPYYPSEEEKNNISLFSSNVRNLFVKDLSLIPTKHSYEDLRLYQHVWKNLGNKMNTIHYIFSDINVKFQMNTKTLTYLADKFNEFDLNHDGFIDYKEFCIVFNINLDNKNSTNKINYKNAFELFDKTNSGIITFNDFVIGILTIYCNTLLDDCCLIFFKMCDYNNNKVINKLNIKYIIERLNLVKNNKSKIELNENKSENENKTNVVINILNSDENKLNLNKIEKFLMDIFKSSNENLDFKTFLNRIHEFHHKEVIQVFMQYLVTVNLGIRLDKNNFKNCDNVTFNLKSLNRSNSVILNESDINKLIKS